MPEDETTAPPPPPEDEGATDVAQGQFISTAYGRPDRRALLVSGLAYVLYAMYALFRSAGAVELSSALTAVAATEAGQGEPAPGLLRRGAGKDAERGKTRSGERRGAGKDTPDGGHRQRRRRQEPDHPTGGGAVRGQTSGDQSLLTVDLFVQDVTVYNRTLVLPATLADTLRDTVYARVANYAQTKIINVPLGS